MIKEQPEGMVLVLVEAVLMPNGEVICLGKPVGFFNQLQEYLHLASEVVPTK